MTKNILFIGMDVHKESIEIAIAEGSNTEVRRYGKIGGEMKGSIKEKAAYAAAQMGL